MSCTEPQSVDILVGDDELLATSTQETRANIKQVLCAFRAIVTPCVYASVPFTTGKRFYQVLDTYGVKTAEDLRRKNSRAMIEQVITPNIEQAIAFTKEVNSRSSMPVLNPALFDARFQNWTQAEYMFLWYRAIEEKASQLHAIDDPYSTGRNQEVLFATRMRFGLHAPFTYTDNGSTARYLPEHLHTQETRSRMRNIKIFNEQGNETFIDTHFDQLLHATIDLHERGFPTTEHVRSLVSLFTIGQMNYDLPLRWQKGWFTKPYEFNFRHMHEGMTRAISYLQLNPEEIWKN